MHPFRRHHWHVLSADWGPNFMARPQTTVNAICQRPNCEKQRHWMVRNANITIELARQRFPRKTWR